MSIKTSNTLFGYFDEEFTVRGIATPTEKYKVIDCYIEDGCVDLSSRKLSKIPFEFINFAPNRITALVLDRNNFKDLSFLQHFSKLTMLSLNKNQNPDPYTLPYMEDLRNLQLDGCFLSDLHQWLKCIKKQCPKISSLSVRSSYFLGEKVSFDEATNRRRTIITMLPTLKRLDNICIDDSEARNATAYLKRKKKQVLCCIL